MFEDSLIEQRIKTHRKAATVVSFLLQVALVSIIVLIPLIFTQALPLNVHSVTELVAPPPPPPPPAAAVPKTAEVQQKSTPVVTQELTQPLKIPQKIAMVQEPTVPLPAAMAAPAGVIGGVPGGVPGGQIGGVLGGVLNSAGVVAPKMKAPNHIRVSQGVSQGLLIHQVTPRYPPAAKSQHVQGTVVLHAEIGKNGKIENLQVVQGPPLLATAAVDAVRQWRYRPYFLNGQPVSIDTMITVNFRLAG